MDYMGLTFYICIGKYGGWRCGKDGPAIRIVLGWVAIVFAWMDIERAIDQILRNDCNNCNVQNMHNGG